MGSSLDGTRPAADGGVFQRRYSGPVIDAHCHFDRSTASRAGELMAATGIDSAIHFWDLQWPPQPFAAEGAEFRQAPDRLFRCHVPDLSTVGVPGDEERLDRALRDAAAAGAVAVKLWKNLGLWLEDRDGARLAVNDARLEPIWEAAAAVGLPIVIHQADPPGFFEPIDDRNPRRPELEMRPEYWHGTKYAQPGQIHEELEAVIAGHPATTFVGLHFGCFMELADVDRMLGAYSNYWIDTATSIADLGHESAWRKVREIVLAHSDRVIFGTDLIRTHDFDLPGLDGSWEIDPTEARWRPLEFYRRHWRFFETAESEIPHPLPFQGDWTVTGLDLPTAVLERLYVDNALSVFAIPEPVARALRPQRELPRR